MKGSFPFPIATLLFLAAHWVVMLFLRTRYGDYRKAYALHRFSANCQPAGEVAVTYCRPYLILGSLVAAFSFWILEVVLPAGGAMLSKIGFVCMFVFIYRLWQSGWGDFIASDGKSLVMRKGIKKREYCIPCSDVVLTEMANRSYPGALGEVAGYDEWRIHTSRGEKYIITARHSEELAALIGAPVDRWLDR
ncbi:hypothetical protein N1030_12990 [Desulfovibrio mangrovi]|uniref:hypothetical protein n=1 Tax=Desulfovibrio mangrovi TaxID=2976983 RepID=UPI0022475C6D|nr:hypothetical protein [Desulfovibrio mangrovi]UZP66518.1 hypothetical protein N1030_12990 [Desulfovibrio mangrovi]